MLWNTISSVAVLALTHLTRAVPTAVMNSDAINIGARDSVGATDLPLVLIDDVVPSPAIRPVISLLPRTTPGASARAPLNGAHYFSGQTDITPGKTYIVRVETDAKVLYVRLWAWDPDALMWKWTENLAPARRSGTKYRVRFRPTVGTHALIEMVTETYVTSGTMELAQVVEPPASSAGPAPGGPAQGPFVSGGPNAPENAAQDTPIPQPLNPDTLTSGSPSPDSSSSEFTTPEPSSPDSSRLVLLGLGSSDSGSSDPSSPASGSSNPGSTSLLPRSLSP